VSLTSIGGGIHPAGAGFVPDLRAFVAWAKTRVPQPLEWRGEFNTRNFMSSPPMYAIQRASRIGSRARPPSGAPLFSQIHCSAIVNLHKVVLRQRQCEGK
jgi:hypothetical protein